ncbi:MAG: choice-of-anchor J domain-containing protein, partial [Bacteroidota bacterium]|nr:choice-of-anchor J domain-containing protein [Bacteroidota bacterium]
MKNLIRTTLIVTLILVLSFPLMGREKEKITLKMSRQIPQSVGNIQPLTATGDTLLNESFEGTVTGWSYIDNDGDGNHWGIYEEDDAPPDTFAHTGLRGAAVHWNGSGNDDWFITPKIGIASGKTVEFSFWARSYLSSFLESFNVKISTTGNSISDFSTRIDSVVDVPFAWTKYTYDLSSYAGDSVTIAVQCVSVDEYYLVTDDYLLTATGGGSPTITSTTTGGDWNDTLTWIGHVVPTASDDVIIDGLVSVNLSDTLCNNLTINSGDTLTKDNNGRTLNVAGDFTNNGTITENNYSEFTIAVAGDIVNNGNWDIANIIFTGTSDNKISMSNGNTINNAGISKVDSVSLLIIGSDSKFNNCSFTNDYYMQGFGNTYQMQIENGTGYTLDLMKSSTIGGVKLNGNSGFLKDANLNDDDNGGASLENVQLKGVVSVASNNITFIGNDVVVVDTLSKDNNGRTLNVAGDFTNNGTITEDNHSEFTIAVAGDIINNGNWDIANIIFTGTSDNKISMSSGNTINNAGISKVDSVSLLIIGSDSKFNNCSFTNDYYMQGFGNTYQMQIENGTGYTLDLMKSSTIGGVKLNGNSGFLKDANLNDDDNGGASLENVQLKGVVSVASNNITFIGNDVVVVDTLSKDNNGRTLTVEGNLTNNGVIYEDNYSEFYFNITGNLINNKIFKDCEINIKGDVNQEIEVNNPIVSTTKLYAMKGTGSYQWKHDGVNISGETGEYLEFDSLNYDVLGDYVCSTDA